MNAEMPLKVRRARRSRLGRLLCRVAGDKTGAVMMEYVLLAVLIGAAAVVAIAMFGKTIVNMFSAAGSGAAGDHTTAAAEVKAAQAEKDAKAAEAKQYHEQMHK